MEEFRHEGGKTTSEIFLAGGNLPLIRPPTVACPPHVVVQSLRRFNAELPISPTNPPRSGKCRQQHYEHVAPRPQPREFRDRRVRREPGTSNKSSPPPSHGSQKLKNAAKDGLFIKVLLAGLIPLLAASGLTLWQSSRAAAERDKTYATETATRLADTLASTFEQNRTQILIAAGNEALQRWYLFPDERETLRPKIDRLQIQLNSLYPDLIDEGCVIDISGVEQARQVRGAAAPIADLSPDESKSPFFAPTFELAVGQVLQARPYVSADSGRWVIANSTIIEINGKKQAFLHFEASLEGYRQRLLNQVPKGVTVRIVDSETGNLLLATDGQPVIDQAFQPAARPLSGIRASTVVNGGANNQNRWNVDVSVPSSPLVSGSDLTELLALVVSATVGLVIVALRFRSKLVTPIDEVVVVAERMAEGDLTQRIHTGNRRDAIGRMGDSVNRAVERLDGALEQIGVEAGSLDLVAGELKSIADGTSGRAASTADLVSSLATAVSGVTSSVSVVADSADGLNQAISEIALRSAGVTSTARDAADMARSTAAAVERLKAASEEIGTSVASIRGIAHTTNQLALNATIEATRAGEFGRGFAVVANEVKSLSQATSTATTDIESRIQAMREETALVDEAMRGITDVVAQIESEQTSIAAAVEEQLAATSEIARAADDASRQVATIDSAVREVEGSARDNQDGARRNLDMADSLAERSRTLADLSAAFTHR